MKKLPPCAISLAAQVQLSKGYDYVWHLWLFRPQFCGFDD